MTGRDYIIVNGVSSDTVGLYVDTPPMPSYQAPVTEAIVIPGRSETITVDQSTREDREVPISGYLFDNTAFEPDDLYAYLSTAKTLVTSKSSKYFYKVNHLQSITPTYQGNGKQFLQIVFQCSPYRYAVDNKTYIYDKDEVWISNNGSYYCQPIYKLYGSGTVQLTVNGDEENKLIIPNVDGYVTVDAEKILCYKENVIVKSKGQIPFLQTGENLIQTNAASIEITLNERWI